MQWITSYSSTPKHIVARELVQTVESAVSEHYPEQSSEATDADQRRIEMLTVQNSPC
jgi:hypothetical protein